MERSAERDDAKRYVSVSLSSCVSLDISTALRVSLALYLSIYPSRERCSGAMEDTLCRRPSVGTKPNVLLSLARSLSMMAMMSRTGDLDLVLTSDLSHCSDESRSWCRALSHSHSLSHKHTQILLHAHARRNSIELDRTTRLPNKRECFRDRPRPKPTPRITIYRERHANARTSVFVRVCSVCVRGERRARD